MPIFSKPVSKTLKCQIGFIFYKNIVLDFPKQLQCLEDKTLSYLENIYLEVVAKNSSMRKKNLTKFEKHLYWSFLCNNVTGWKPPTLLQRDPGIGVVL